MIMSSSVRRCQAIRWSDYTLYIRQMKRRLDFLNTFSPSPIKPSSFLSLMSESLLWHHGNVWVVLIIYFYYLYSIFYNLQLSISPVEICLWPFTKLLMKRNTTLTSVSVIWSPFTTCMTSQIKDFLYMYWLGLHCGDLIVTNFNKCGDGVFALYKLCGAVMTPKTVKIPVSSMKRSTIAVLLLTWQIFSSLPSF